MIVKMSKYDFILYARECESFVARLRELGLVDITTSSWEASESDRSLVVEIEGYTKALKALGNFAGDERFDSQAKGYSSGEEAYSAYSQAMQSKAQWNSEITRLEKIESEMTPWGEFSVADLAALASQGLSIRYFYATVSAFESLKSELGGEYTLEVINEGDSLVCFVLIGAEEVEVAVQEIKSLTMTASAARGQISELEAKIDALSSVLSRAANSVEMIETQKAVLVSHLQESQIKSSAEVAADGSLLVLEGWAESATSKSVDALLDEYPNVVYFKRDPTPEDNTPIKLKNRWFANIFEMITNLYAMPKYGTIDLTPFFAPFYMLFFAICLCDAGYGLMILLTGLALYFKGGDAMRQASWLSIMCGSAAVIFGFFANSFFGMSISSLSAFDGFKFINFQQDFFSVAMIIGIVQLLFGMLINIFVTTRAFGIKYALGSIGWFMVLTISLCSAALTEFGVEGFGFDSIPFYVGAGVGGVLMLFFNSPDKNIFVNFGAGIWNTYNNITGLLGDVLSYIRLFAIGLSGGVLALVFNDLALGMTGLNEGLSGQPIVSIILKILAATAILLVGHGLNLFMSTISSFVHPMRLTFVEFYKNAGFQMATRKFTPLKK
ncbi:MAG: V-type ATP synthase subunit I [Rikenellaceae bacterium]